VPWKEIFAVHSLANVDLLGLRGHSQSLRNVIPRDISNLFYFPFAS